MDALPSELVSEILLRLAATWGRGKPVYRPLTGYLLFAEETKRKLKEEQPNLSHQLYGHLSAALWLSQTPSAKQSWSDPDKLTVVDPWMYVKAYRGVYFLLAALVCKAWRDTLAGNTLWRKLCALRFPDLLVLPNIATATNCKRTFLARLPKEAAVRYVPPSPKIADNDVCIILDASLYGTEGNVLVAFYWVLPLRFEEAARRSRASDALRREGVVPTDPWWEVVWAHDSLQRAVKRHLGLGMVDEDVARGMIAQALENGAMTFRFTSMRLWRASTHQLVDLLGGLGITSVTSFDTLDEIGADHLLNDTAEGHTGWSLLLHLPTLCPHFANFLDLPELPRLIFLIDLFTGEMELVLLPGNPTDAQNLTTARLAARTHKMTELLHMIFSGSQ
jgi:hypothetical protein